MNQKLRWAFKAFARNDRWGTCADCPRTSEGEPFPEFCEYTKRYDHQLILTDLAHSHVLDRTEVAR